MTLPTISIVTPSFNQATFIEDTLTSVLNQNYPELEYIVIDGGSTDGAVEIIEKYRDKIRYFVSEADSGHGNALNKGFRQSSGEIMGWLNSDDKYLPWTLRTVADIFDQHPDVSWITGTQARWNDKGAMIETCNVYKNRSDFLIGNFKWIQQESVFWRRSLWIKAGSFINENFKLMVDGELWTRFFLHEELWHVKCILSGYRMHKANRARLFDEECEHEMMKAIDVMRQELGRGASSIKRGYCLLTYDPERSLWVKRRKRRGVRFKSYLRKLTPIGLRRVFKNRLSRKSL